ncbi:monocarboxylate transporter 12-like isoform X2 [Acanthaster planci]|nr:monocarboxylate transporter 12-like isoform X2 [Acanthaster planci]XP_022102628.1 monocarboxylate transporter 12-like isoform X2 [Acanthaster planci]
MGGSNRSTLGVLATIAVFLQFFLQAMIIKTLGILLVDMREEFEAATWEMGTIFEFVECVNDFLAPIAGALGMTFGARPTVMISGIMITAGFMVASRASNVLQIALYLNIFVGIGYAFPHVLARANLAQHYDDRQFSLASGIGKTGSAFSLLVLPPLVQLCLDEYGWRGALLVVSAMAANFIVCGALMIPKSRQKEDGQEYQPLPGSRTSQKRSKQGMLAQLKATCVNITRRFDPILMRENKFWVILLFYVLGRIGKSAWIIYFVPHAVEKGFSMQTATTMATVAGLGYIMGITIASLAMFKEKVTSSVAFLLSLALFGISFIIDPWMNSVWLVSANAVLLMMGNASMWAASDVIMKEVLGAEKMANAYGWIGLFSGMCRPIAGFLPGWIFDQTGSYNLAFVIIGIIEMTALLPFIVRRRLDVGG